MPAERMMVVGKRGPKEWTIYYNVGTPECATHNQHADFVADCCEPFGPDHHHHHHHEAVFWAQWTNWTIGLYQKAETTRRLGLLRWFVLEFLNGKSCISAICMEAWTDKTADMSSASSRPSNFAAQWTAAIVVALVTHRHYSIGCGFSQQRLSQRLFSR